MEQRLTPQLIQSMSILQKPVTELEAYIAEALERNAALEIDEPQAEPPPSNGKTADRPGPTNEESGFARLEQMSRDYRDLDMDWVDGRPSFLRRAASDDRDPKMAAMANTAGRDADLNEHLSDQWAMLDLDDEVRRAGEVIINNIDPDGYLRTRLETISEQTKPRVSMESMETALRQIHQLEPPGVGARDIVECLLLQLDAQPGDNSIERKLIEKHLDDITHNRLPAVARATGYSTGEIGEAIKAMRHSLCLHPGYLVGDRSLPPIRPDVIVEYSGTSGGLEVRLARGNSPRLKISEDVASLARSKQNGKETREFAKKQVEEASALIDAVTFRRSRLLEVARSIVEKQREFFDVGPQGLKVLRMSDLAAELGCDPSTISRTVADKYMQTPRGIYPLRYFFTGGTENDEGESIGWDRVKDRVREVIEAEDKSAPLNDDQVANLLKKEGVDISRRTVAKYRAQLDIPSARQRKAY